MPRTEAPHHRCCHTRRSGHRLHFPRVRHAETTSPTLRPRRYVTDVHDVRVPAGKQRGGCVFETLYTRNQQKDPATRTRGHELKLSERGGCP